MFDPEMDGLNYVPQLAQSSTPPSSTRSRLTIPSARTISLHSENGVEPLTVTSFNGNYEGDDTMFGPLCPSREVVEYLDSDSESEFKFQRNELIGILNQTSPILPAPLQPESQTPPWIRTFNYWVGKVVAPEQADRLTSAVERISTHNYMKRILSVLSFIVSAMAVVVRLVLMLFIIIGSWTYGVWKSLTTLRNWSRHLLWMMTLAKCGDVSYFVLIVALTPVLFCVATFGLILACYMTLRDWLLHQRPDIDEEKEETK